jgi:probable phosphoglycerate mutase
MAAAEAAGVDLRPPGGESPREVQARIRPMLAEIAATRPPDRGGDA